MRRWLSLTFLLLSALPAPAAEVWVQDPFSPVTSKTAKPANASKQLTLIVPRGGSASGLVVCKPDSPQRITVTPPVFKGPAALPKDAVQIRYVTRYRDLAPAGDSLPAFDFYDALSPSPITDSLQPTLLTVTVPRTFAPGNYTAAWTVSGTTINITLTITPFTMPAAGERFLYINTPQSPQTIAQRYSVAPWSDAHFTKIEESLKLAGRLGTNIMYVPVIGRSYLGQDVGMITFTKKGNSYEPDFRVFDRYFELWQKHCGKPRYVIPYVWCKSFAEDKKRPQPKTVAITLREGNALKPIEIERPPAHEKMWQQLFDGVRSRIRKTGLADYNVLIGQACDIHPDKDIVEMYERVAPGIRWSTWTHGYGYQRTSEQMTGSTGFVVGLNMGPDIGDGESKRGLGRARWRGPDAFITLNTARVFLREQTAVDLGWRIAPDLSADRHPQGACLGLAMVGLDFWPTRKAADGKWDTIWGGPYPGLAYCRLDRGQPNQITVPGPNGALPTLRYEMLVEGAQEAEARLLLETSPKDPDALAAAKARYEALQPAMNNNGMKSNDVPADWAESLRKLYELAAKLQK